MFKRKRVSDTGDHDHLVKLIRGSDKKFYTPLLTIELVESKFSGKEFAFNLHYRRSGAVNPPVQDLTREEIEQFRNTIIEAIYRAESYWRKKNERND